LVICNSHIPFPPLHWTLGRILPHHFSSFSFDFQTGHAPSVEVTFY
jgi:hypothetical protein